MVEVAAHAVANADAAQAGLDLFQANADAGIDFVAGGEGGGSSAPVVAGEEEAVVGDAGFGGEVELVDVRLHLDPEFTQFVASDGAWIYLHGSAGGEAEEAGSERDEDELWQAVRYFSHRGILIDGGAGDKKMRGRGGDRLGEDFAVEGAGLAGGEVVEGGEEGVVGELEEGGEVSAVGLVGKNVGGAGPGLAVVGGGGPFDIEMELAGRSAGDSGDFAIFIGGENAENFAGFEAEERGG